MKLDEQPMCVELNEKILEERKNIAMITQAIEDACASEDFANALKFKNLKDQSIKNLERLEADQTKTPEMATIRCSAEQAMHILQMGAVHGVDLKQFNFQIN